MKCSSEVMIAKTSLEQADLYLLKNKPGRAFAHFLVALKLNADLKPQLKHTFASTLRIWGETLQTHQKYQHLFKCYEQALEVFPENEAILNNLGSHLYRMGHLKEASVYFRQAIRQNDQFPLARRNLQNVCSLLVERWHFRMLNDAVRNRAFREVITRRVGLGSTSVLDIGTGTGMLSLFAVKAEARQVFACDCSPTMLDIAHQVMAANDATGKVHLIGKMSMELRIPADLPHRVSMVVTETLDAGLFGEQILDTLLHAWDHLLLAPSPELAKWNPGKVASPEGGYGVVVPLGARVWVAPIECLHVARKNRLLTGDGSKLCGLEFSHLQVLANTGEPYDTEDLITVPGGFRLLASPTAAMTANFNNPASLAALNGGVEHHIGAICEASGRVDAVAAWFTLFLDAHTTLSSDPRSKEGRAPCWDQVVFPMNGESIARGQTLKFTISCQGGKLAVKLDKPGQGPSPAKDATEPTQDIVTHFGDIAISPNNIGKDILDPITYTNGQRMDEEDIASASQHAIVIQRVVQSDIPATTCHTSQEAIRFLNDTQWMESLSETLNQLGGIEQRNYFILDLSPFPILGLSLLLNCSPDSTRHLTCSVRTEGEERTIRAVAQVNGIDSARIRCLSEECIPKLSANRDRFNLILAHLVNPCGELDETAIVQLPMLRTLLRKDGLLLPKRISMFCNLVQSDWLTTMSQVRNDDVTCGYKIADYINTYQVSQHLDLNLLSLDHIKVSEPFRILDTSVAEMHEAFILSGCIKVVVKNPGPVNAIPYWFSIQMLEAGRSVSTTHESSHLNQAVILLDPAVDLSNCSSATVSVVYQRQAEEECVFPMVSLSLQ